MSKPKDIPQAVWDAAELEVRRWPLDTNCVPEVARIILAERRRCASIARAIDSGRGNEEQIAVAIERGDA